MDKYITNEGLNADNVSKYFHKQALKCKKIQYGSIAYRIKLNKFINKYSNKLNKNQQDMINVIAKYEWGKRYEK